MYPSLCSEQCLKADPFSMLMHTVVGFLQMSCMLFFKNSQKLVDLEYPFLKHMIILDVWLGSSCSTISQESYLVSSISPPDIYPL